MQGRAERAIRGTLVGAASVILAAAAHTAAGGEPPGWLALGVGLVAASLVGTLLIGRRPALLRTAVVVGLGQGGFHYLFAGLGGPGVVVAAEHVHTVGGVTVTHAEHLTSPPMIVAHLVAALLTVVLLHSAEAAAWRMLRDAVRRLLRRASVRPAAPAPRRAVPSASPRPASAPLFPTARLRGPPLPV